MPPSPRSPLPPPPRLSQLSCCRCQLPPPAIHIHLVPCLHTQSASPMTPIFSPCPASKPLTDLQLPWSLSCPCPSTLTPPFGGLREASRLLGSVIHSAVVNSHVKRHSMCLCSNPTNCRMPVVFPTSLGQSPDTLMCGTSSCHMNRVHVPQSYPQPSRAEQLGPWGRRQIPLHMCEVREYDTMRRGKTTDTTYSAWEKSIKKHQGLLAKIARPVSATP